MLPDTLKFGEPSLGATSVDHKFRHLMVEHRRDDAAMVVVMDNVVEVTGR